MNAKGLLYLILVAGVVLTVGALLFLGSARIIDNDSMAPTLRSGDLVFLQPIKDFISPGMVVSYDFQGERITHRVVEVLGDMLVTKGDNNQEIDPWHVPFSSVHGVPDFRIPYMGYLLGFAQSPAGILLMIILPFCLIIVIESRRVASRLQDSNLIEN